MQAKWLGVQHGTVCVEGWVGGRGDGGGEGMAREGDNQDDVWVC
jgi:hypothetical protein